MKNYRPVTFVVLGFCAPAVGDIIVNQAPVSGGGISRWSQLWQDPTPAGNDLDGDSVCWQDFTLSHSKTISHVEWWGLGACELGFQLEFWKQDPGTIAYQPLGVFYYGGVTTVQPEPPGFMRFTPSEYTTSAGPGGIFHYSLDLPNPVTLAANDSANPRWFLGVVGLTHQAYYTWNWAQGLGGSNRTFQFVRGEGPMFRSLGEGRALLLGDAATAIDAQWTGDIDSAWTNSGNWSGGVPNGVGHAATFASIVSGNYFVTIDGAGKTIGTATFDDLNSYTIGGTGPLTLDVSSGQATVNVISGSHLISAPVTLADDTTITVTPLDGAITFSGALNATTHSITKSGAGVAQFTNVRAPQLSVNSGTVGILTDGTDAGASRVTTLAIAGGVTPTASLDLNDNDLVVTGGSYATLTAQIAQARNGGLWDRTGITSSAAAFEPTQGTTLGVLSGAQYRSLYGASATFDSFAVANSDTLVKYTWYGDTDFNGIVDFDDYVRTDAGYNGGLSGWLNGDSNFDGIVDFDDYVVMDLAYNVQNGTLLNAINWITGQDRSASSGVAMEKMLQHLDQFGLDYANAFLAAVPEPSLAVISLGALAGLRRRRRWVSTEAVTSEPSLRP